MLISTESTNAGFLLGFSLSTNMLPTSITSQEHCSISHLYGLTVHIKREGAIPCDFFLFHKMQPAKYSYRVRNIFKRDYVSS